MHACWTIAVHHTVHLLAKQSLRLTCMDAVVQELQRSWGGRPCKVLSRLTAGHACQLGFGCSMQQPRKASHKPCHAPSNPGSHCYSVNCYCAKCSQPVQPERKPSKDLRSNLKHTRHVCLTTLDTMTARTLTSVKTELLLCEVQPRKGRIR